MLSNVEEVAKFHLLITKIDKALTNKDWSELSRIAHKFKGSFG